MIFIRADANEVIATGHIMRSSAIAEAFVEEGEDVSFIVADKYGEELVKKQGFPCVVLNSDYRNMEGEISTLKEMLNATDAELLLVDSYFVTERYFDVLKENVRTAYIDDFQGKQLSCDALINYNLGVTKEYYNDYDENITFLLGGNYTPLRKQFRNLKERKIRDRVSEILILTGGSDHYHVVFNICRTLILRKDQFDTCVVNIVCGRYNEDYERIVELTEPFSWLKVYKNIYEIDLFMRKADVCISAGGTTTKELAACGTPTITISIADNQFEGVKSLERAGLMKYYGDVRNDPFSYSGLIKELLVLCADKERRIRESKLLQKTIDGMGAVRIARELLK